MSLSTLDRGRETSTGRPKSNGTHWGLGDLKGTYRAHKPT